MIVTVNAFSENTQKIHITADILKTNTSGKEAEFSGNVKTLFDNTNITCENLKIFFKENGKKTASLTENSIEKIIASGNVVIKTDDGIEAKCEKALYTAETELLVLTGKNTTVYKDKNIIIGDKITIEKKTNNIIAEKGAEKRVEFFLYPKEK